MSALAPDDKNALKAAVLAGIETAERFHTLSPREQAAFVRNCVLSQLGGQVGFTLAPLRFGLFPPAIVKVTAKAYEHTLKKAGADSFVKTPSWPVTSAVMRNGETYCYVLDCAFEAKDDSGEWTLTAMLDASGRFFRTIYDWFEPKDDQ